MWKMEPKTTRIVLWLSQKSQGGQKRKAHRSCNQYIWDKEKTTRSWNGILKNLRIRKSLGKLKMLQKKLKICGWTEKQSWENLQNIVQKKKKQELVNKWQDKKIKSIQVQNSPCYSLAPNPPMVSHLTNAKAKLLHTQCRTWFGTHHFLISFGDSVPTHFTAASLKSSC